MRLVAASQRRKPQQSGQAQLQSRGRQDMMAYSGPPPSRFAQREVNPPPPDTTEKQADPFADPAPQKEPAAAPAAEMPTELPADAPPEAEPPTRPSDDLFTEPPAGPERPTRRAPPSRQAPSRSRQQAPPQQSPPRSRQQPPAEFVPPPPEPEPYRSSSGEPAYEEPYYDELYGEDDFAGNCMSCAESAGCSSLWDQYCPPPLNLHIPRGTWANLDYLMWWSRGASLPPLVTTGSQGGALNDPNLKILYGNDRVENTIRSGGRLNIGTWFNPQQTFGIGAYVLAIAEHGIELHGRIERLADHRAAVFQHRHASPRFARLRADGHIRRRSSRPRDRQLRGWRYVSALGPDPTAGHRLDLVYGWR